MEVLHPTSDLAPPNMCVICRETPDRTKRVVDTGQSFVIPNSDIVGRAYVCEKCGLTIANRLGFVSNEQAKIAFHAAESAASRLAAVKEKILVAAEDIHAFATDVSLGNERSSVGKWVEGEFSEEIPASGTKATGSVRKPAKGSSVSAGKSGSGDKSPKVVDSIASSDQSPTNDNDGGGRVAGADAGT